MPKIAKVAIIILNYNNPVATIRCLNSLKLLLAGETSFDTIVVDNGSTDNSVDQIFLNYPEIKLIKSKTNLGFAGGNNLGIKKALDDRYPFILLLNNDTQIIDDQMLDRLIEKKSDLTGPMIKYHQNNIAIVDFGGVIDWYKGRNTHRDYPEKEIPSIVPPADYISGTCLLIRSDVFERIGLLDDKYFLYYEDVDFCLRARKAGLKITHCKDTKIYHQLSASANQIGKKKIKYLAASHRRFVMTHLNPIFWPLALVYNLYLTIKSF